VPNDFRGRNRQRADEVPLVIGLAEIEWVTGEIDTALRVFSVKLIAEEIELARFQFQDEWTFRGIRSVPSLTAIRDKTCFVP
jgi:hypothetical protein